MATDDIPARAPRKAHMTDTHVRADAPTTKSWSTSPAVITADSNRPELAVNPVEGSHATRIDETEPNLPALQAEPQDPYAPTSLRPRPVALVKRAT
jgi:hypothetical protein